MTAPATRLPFTTMRGVNLGFCFDREFPPSFVREVATRLEAGGIDQLWVIEDCFYTTAPSLAATALAVTDRLNVGVGILPAVARNAAITAMELATLERLAPGRLIAGIGHGVQEWMEQMGARSPSPLTVLDEVIVTVRALLAGETVDVEGRHVRMRSVALQPPPEYPPPVLAGVRGPKSLALAGRIADGVVLAEGTGPAALRIALSQVAQGSVSGLDPEFRVSVFTAFRMTDDGADARRAMAPVLVAMLDGEPNPALAAHPHIDEIRERRDVGGLDALADMPSDWWTEIGAIGDRDDVLRHIDALHQAGATDVALFPSSDVDQARRDLDAAIDIRRALPR